MLSNHLFCFLRISFNSSPMFNTLNENMRIWPHLEKKQVNVCMILPIKKTVSPTDIWRRSPFTMAVMYADVKESSKAIIKQTLIWLAFVSIRSIKLIKFSQKTTRTKSQIAITMNIKKPVTSLFKWPNMEFLKCAHDEKPTKQTIWNEIDYLYSKEIKIQGDNSLANGRNVVQYF